MLYIIVNTYKRLYVQGGNQKETEHVASRFALGAGYGLLTLARANLRERECSTSVSYWLSFVNAYLHEFCSREEGQQVAVSTVTRSKDLVRRFVEHCPEMKGAENIDASFLQQTWGHLDACISEIMQSKGLSQRAFLHEYFPDWLEVGQVHFHLAECQPGAATPFAFLATCTTRVEGKARVQHAPLSQLLSTSTATRMEPDRIRDTKDSRWQAVWGRLRRTADDCEFLYEMLVSKRIMTATPLSSQEAFSFLQEVERYGQHGIIVKLPRDWQSRSGRAKVSVTIDGQEKQKSQVGFDAMFGFRAQLTVDGQVLEGADLARVLAADETLVQIRGRWIQVDGPRTTRILAKWHQAARMHERGLGFGEAMRMLAGMPLSTDHTVETEVEADDANWLDFRGSNQVDQTIASMIAPAAIVDDLILPCLADTLQAELRPYQLDGVKWLSMLSKVGLGGCLADDMGLGKTIQVISLLLIEKRKMSKAPSLLIVPASLLGNWRDELIRFAPSLQYAIAHRSFLPAGGFAAIAASVVQLDVILTTYSMCDRLDWIMVNRWNLIIADEAQAIKNPEAKQTKTVKRLNGRCRIVLTGTPIENSLQDLWSLMDFCCPNLLGSRKAFMDFYTKLKANGNYGPLRKLIRPYILRRKKSDRSVISDLPDKIDLKTYCNLSAKQIFLYRKLIADLKVDLSLETPDIKRKGLVLSYLLKFKQICNHPSLLLGDHDYQYDDSGKFKRLGEIIETIDARGEKVLVFTQFREMTDIIASFLKGKFGREGLVLHGGTAMAKRQSLVKRFQEDDSLPFFVLSVKAGGTGLNLTAASHVIHFDRWWNPAVENQATDRAFRIGQKCNVMVHKFVCNGTIESKIDQMIEGKKDLADQIVENFDPLKITEMSTDEILDMVRLDITNVSSSHSFPQGDDSANTPISDPRKSAQKRPEGSVNVL